MQHPNRVWAISPATQQLREHLPEAPDGAAAAELLARYLTEHTATLCTGFALGNYYFLNDSDSPFGVQSYGIVDNRTLDQIDSVDFSRLDVPTAWEYILNLLDGNYEDMPTMDTVRSRHLVCAEHHRCCSACQ